MRLLTTCSLALLLGVLAVALTPADAGAFCRTRDCCPPPPPVKVVLQVCHPCTGCKHDVIVCIPACCAGAPCVRFEHTLIGPGRTRFTWACGHEVVVRYKACGDIVVRG